MTDIICRFLATPSPVFDLGEKGSKSVQEHAIIRLAQCVQTRFDTHGTQPAISTVYALLNEITRYSNSEHKPRDSIISGAPALEQLTESQKQQVCANVLSAIVGVAVYLKDEEVNRRKGKNGKLIFFLHRSFLKHFQCWPYAENY